VYCVSIARWPCAAEIEQAVVMTRPATTCFAPPKRSACMNDRRIRVAKRRLQKVPDFTGFQCRRDRLKTV
jgi:hypothetical protein